jgi:hypothetical protein
VYHDYILGQSRFSKANQRPIQQIRASPKLTGS